MLTAFRFLILLLRTVELEQELTEVFRQALHTAGFMGGPMVEEFETSFADIAAQTMPLPSVVGRTRCDLPLMACGVGARRCRVTVPNTFIATTEAISQAGALPEFVDIDERTYNLSVQMLERVPGKAVRRGTMPGSSSACGAEGLSPLWCRCTYTGRWRIWMRS